MKTVNDHLANHAGSPAPSDSSLSRATTLAVVVTHEPDRAVLTQLVETVSAVVPVLVVDNSESEAGTASALAVAAAFDCRFIANPRNLGVAEAQNIGIRSAKEGRFRYVLLLDQDSIPEPHVVSVLVDEAEALKRQGHRVAAVGASYVDPRNGMRYPFVRLRRLRMEKVWPEPGSVIECDMLISSGCLICVDAIHNVGEMDSGLFIDYVDFEWCRRAVAKGYRIFAVADAKMHHTIGDKSFQAMGRSFNLHSPVRQYYFIRNALLFARRPYLSIRWRAHLLYRVAGQFVLFSVFAPNRFARTAWMLRGLIDGMLGRQGRVGGPDGIQAMKPARSGVAVPALATPAADLSPLTSQTAARVAE